MTKNLIEHWVRQAQGGSFASMGLMHVIWGMTIVVFAMLFYAYPRVRHLETILPDYTK